MQCVAPPKHRVLVCGKIVMGLSSGSSQAGDFMTELCMLYAGVGPSTQALPTLYLLHALSKRVQLQLTSKQTFIHLTKLAGPSGARLHVQSKSLVPHRWGGVSVGRYARHTCAGCVGLAQPARTCHARLPSARLKGSTVLAVRFKHWSKRSILPAVFNGCR